MIIKPKKKRNKYNKRKKNTETTIQQLEGRKSSNIFSNGQSIILQNKPVNTIIHITNQTFN